MTDKNLFELCSLVIYVLEEVYSYKIPNVLLKVYPYFMHNLLPEQPNLHVQFNPGRPT